MSGVVTFSSEACFAKLFALLAVAQTLVNGLPSGFPAFVTTGRKAVPVANVSPAEQPALFLMEGEVDYAPDDAGLSVDVLHAAAIVYFRNTQGDTGIPSQQLNALRDAVVYQMRQKTITQAGAVVDMTLGDRQTLGGTCVSAAIKGKALANEGLLNNQGAIVFPISILTGV